MSGAEFLPGRVVNGALLGPCLVTSVRRNPPDAGHRHTHAVVVLKQEGRTFEFDMDLHEQYPGFSVVSMTHTGPGIGQFPGQEPRQVAR